MSSPNSDDFFELGPEHENPAEPGNFFPLGPEHEAPELDITRLPQEGTESQWQGKAIITLRDGSKEEQLVRIKREETDTTQDVIDKMILASIEIQLIIAERGGNYDIEVDFTSIEAV